MTQTQLDILWGHVTDNVGITAFNFYVDGVLHLTIPGKDCKTKCSSQTSGVRAILTNLTKGKNHDFKIEACDAAGNCSVKLPKIREDKNKVPFASGIGTNFNLNIPSVNEDAEIVRYEVYVNGVLSTHETVTDSKLFVYPKFDMTCGDQYIELIAFDKDDNEVKKYPSITITQTDSCISVIATPTTTTTTLPGTPTVTITASQVSDGDTSADSSITLTFITSASTTNFAAGDVTVSGGTLSNFIGFATQYAATFTPTAVGATTIDVAANTFTNTATGINNVAATQFNWTYSTASASTTSANRWVIAVIDETGSAIVCAGNASSSSNYPGPSHNGNCDVNGAWGEFRTLWPNRKFFLIEPMRDNGTQSLTGLDQSIKSASNILMPTAFVTEAQAGVKAVYIQSTNSDSSGTNWWSRKRCTPNQKKKKVILWVDNSGSMTTSTVQGEYNAFLAAAASANVTITEVTNLTSGQGGSLAREDWINPFDPDYP